MGPYQRARTHPRSGEHQSGRDIELENQVQDQEKSPTVAEEESERLLPGGGPAADDDDVESKAFDAPRRPHRRWLRLPQNHRLRMALFGLAGLALIAIAAVLLSRASDAESERRTVRMFKRPSTDYIIPRDWNYDAPPKARYQRWTITDIVANPDGVFRPMTVINGKFPGPMIVCNEGDTIVIDVTNHAQNATSIHWHGLFQNGTNFMDGTPGVTQCPIAPGESFRYQFTVTGQAGSCKCALLAPPKSSSVLTRARLLSWTSGC